MLTFTRPPALRRRRKSTVSLYEFCFILAETLFGRKQKEIAEALGMTPQYVAKVCRRFGVYRYDKRTLRERQNAGENSNAIGNRWQARVAGDGRDGVSGN